MRALRLLPLSAVLLTAPLAAQDVPTPAAPPTQPKAPPTAVAPRVEDFRMDSMRAFADSARRWSWRFRDSIQPLIARSFSLRRVRIGVVVGTRPLDSDSIGALLDAVTPGGPAASAGLRAGDIVTRFNGTPLGVKPADLQPGVRVSSPGIRLVELVAQLQPNDTVTVVYRRGTRQQSAKVVTAADPDNLTVVLGPDGGYGFSALPGGESYWIQGDSAEQRAVELALRRSEAGLSALKTPEGMRAPMRWRGPFMGLELAPVNPQLGSYFGTTEGVLVVDAPSPALLGLKAGDVVVSVDGRKVTGPSQLLRILGSYAPDEPVKLEVMRQKKRITLQGTIDG